MFKTFLVVYICLQTRSFSSGYDLFILFITLLPHIYYQYCMPLLICWNSKHCPDDSIFNITNQNCTGMISFYCCLCVKIQFLIQFFFLRFGKSFLQHKTRYYIHISVLVTKQGGFTILLFNNFFADCSSGYYGLKCLQACRYPNYGPGCQRNCHCEERNCNHIKGCLMIGGKMLTFT